MIGGQAHGEELGKRHEVWCHRSRCAARGVFDSHPQTLRSGALACARGSPSSHLDTVRAGR